MAGTVVPLLAFAPWLAEHGLEVALLARHAVATPVSAFAWADVVISVLVVLVLILVEGRRLRMSRLWLPIVGLCTVGVSLGLPLFLLMRERHLSATPR